MRKVRARSLLPPCCAQDSEHISGSRGIPLPFYAYMHAVRMGTNCNSTCHCGKMTWGMIEYDTSININQSSLTTNITSQRIDELINWQAQPIDKLARWMQPFRVRRGSINLAKLGASVPTKAGGFGWFLPGGFDSYHSPRETNMYCEEFTLRRIEFFLLCENPCCEECILPCFAAMGLKETCMHACMCICCLRCNIHSGTA